LGVLVLYIGYCFSWLRVLVNICMRFFEFSTLKPIKPKKPLNPQQARVASLKRNIDTAKNAYKAEKNRQKIARAQQQIFNASREKYGA
jgi:hypothetical protein